MVQKESWQGATMMVETMLESLQDMNSTVLPQWKRELLQRRAARNLPPLHYHTASPSSFDVSPNARSLRRGLSSLPDNENFEEEEELRYGPGIVKRLKSRYLSLALRDAPRRRPSLLRRAASLEHLLDADAPSTSPAPVSTPSPRPRPSARPVSTCLVPPPEPLPRESVKRARSVDALSRLEVPPPPAPPPPVRRPPRRPAPLLRTAERPPHDLVRTALRKFEPTPLRRQAPAANVSAALRGLGAPHPPHPPPLPPPSASSTPEPRSRLPTRGKKERSPEGGRLLITEVEKFSLEAESEFRVCSSPSPLSPPNSATNPVLLSRVRTSPASPRRIGVIRPMIASPVERDTTPPQRDTVISPSPVDDAAAKQRPPLEARGTGKESVTPPAVAVEPIMRANADNKTEKKESKDSDLKPATFEACDGVRGARREEKCEKKEWASHSPTLKRREEKCEKKEWASHSPTLKRREEEKMAPWGSLKPHHVARPAVTSNSIVFNFSDRKDPPPDYIENDGLILRRNRREALKAGDPGVVVLHSGGGVGRFNTGTEPDYDSDEIDCGPPSPCSLKFVNDNVLINGRSSMPTRPNPLRTANLKLQFDDSLTRTFEYPSETSLCEFEKDFNSKSELTIENGLEDYNDNLTSNVLTSNTHLVSAALSNYRPSKTNSDTFQLGVTRAHHRDLDINNYNAKENNLHSDKDGDNCNQATPCADATARSWSTDSCGKTTDLLF